MTDRRPSLLLILALAAGLPLVACNRREGHVPAAASPAAQLPAVSAPLAAAERLIVPLSTDIAGTVEAARTTSVSSRVVALVTAVHARLGDRVAAGQILVTIDPTAAEGQVAQAQGALAQATAALTLAERNLGRFEALTASQAASQLELDLARMQHAQAQGAVEQARGALAAARSVAAESRVVAPYAGRISARTVEVGDLAAPGRPLMRLESEGGELLVVAVPEQLAGAAGLAAGMSIPVTLDARSAAGDSAGSDPSGSSGPPSSIQGILAELSPGPDPFTHAYTARISLEGAEASSGAAGRAWISVGEREVIAVPVAARIESGGLDLVVVRDGAGLARSRAVTFGRELAGDRIEVLSGLAAGELVALGLTAAPRSGSPLEPTAAVLAGAIP